MNNLIDRLARNFAPVPPFSETPNRRQAARDQVAAGSIILASVVLAVIAVLSFVLSPMLGYAALWLAIGGACGPLSLLALRRTIVGSNLFAVPLTLNAVTLGLAVWASGGASSPLIWALLVWPVMALGTGARLPLFVTGAAVLCMAAILWATSPLHWESVAAARGLALTLVLVFMALGALGAVRQSTHLSHALADADDRALQSADQLNALSTKLSKYLAPQLYASIFEGKQDVQLGAERKKLTVYFSDIVNFTETTEAMEAEDLAHLMNDYFDNMAEVILKHGGTIDKYMGDAIMVFFGDPESRGTREDAVACVSMALEMEERLRNLQGKWQAMGITQPVQMRAGINTGYCTVGNFGSENRMDYTIIGGQVNVAARLEAAAGPGAILVSQHTYALVRDQFAFEDAGEFAVKGLSANVAAYRLRNTDSRFAKGALIREQLDGLSLVVDPKSLSDRDRQRAVEKLQLAIDRLKD